MRKQKRTVNRIRAVAAAALLILSCGFAACGKEPEQPNIPIQELLVCYPLDNMLAYTAAEDGTVFAVNLDMSEEEPTYKLHRFGPQGEDEECIPLEKTAMVEAMAVSADGKEVYFTAQMDGYGADLALFTYGAEDGKISMECALPYFDSIGQVVLVENVVYLLGKSPGWQSADAPDDGYSFAGERLVSYAPDTGELTQLGFDFPISMSAGGNGTLVVFGYLAGTGYCMMEYDAAKDSMQVISPLEEYKFTRFAVCDGGKAVIYDYSVDSRGLVLSDITNLSVEAELYPDGITIKMPPFCAGGRIYCDSRGEGGLVSFPLDAVRRDNKELSFITREHGILSSPYGCGYAIDRVELSDEKFTLKVLARDKDYDLCMGESLLGGSRDLRENGVFYPLNDVPGIEEYFARCFPYVREAATKENGNIWMLPVKVNVCGLVAKQQACKGAGLSLHAGMTWVEYAQMLDGAKEEDRALMDISFRLMTSVFGEQYFTHYHTLENELFANTYTALAGIGQQSFGEKATEENSILMSMAEPLWLEWPGLRQEFGEDATFFAMPKLTASDKNFASCTFLAVNPDSARREEALAYLADLVAYLMQQENLPFFTDWQGEGELDLAMHKAYEDAEIVFAVEADVYEEGFAKLLSGEIPLSEYKQKTEPKLGMYWGE